MVTTQDGAFVSATVLRSEAVNWTVANYKSKYADFFDVCELNAVLSNGCNATMYDHRDVKRDTDIGGRNCRWGFDADVFFRSLQYYRPFG